MPGGYAMTDAAALIVIHGAYRRLRTQLKKILPVAYGLHCYRCGSRLERGAGGHYPGCAFRILEEVEAEVRCALEGRPEA